MSKKSTRIAELIESSQGGHWPANYVGYFKCFNEGLYFEAHDVLEELWLKDRQSANYAYYKGLIQLAGAFVHLQKDRLKPSSALFNLARNNLAQYPAFHDGIHLTTLLDLTADWKRALEEGKFNDNPLKKKPAPQLAMPEEQGDKR